MKLNKAEKKWLEDLQAVLDACPSKRIGFFSIGDPCISLYDRGKEKEIHAIMDRKQNLDFPGAVNAVKADIDVQLDFPSNVHSVAG